MGINDSCSLGIDIGGSSVKLALIHDGGEPLTSRSQTYEKPTLDLLAERIRSTFDSVLEQSSLSRGSVKTVGVCVAGPMDNRGVIEMAANLPVLAGVCMPDWIRSVLQMEVPVTPSTDANAAAACEHRFHPKQGRTLYLSLGTGVGGAVLDDGKPVIITRGTSGHFGHMDVSGGEPDAPATDGAGRGALEAYVGFRTLQAAGVPLESDDRFEHPAMQRAIAALARGLRILLAIYRPDHIVLMGGGVDLYAPAIDQIRLLVNEGLTRAAPEHWSLSVAHTDNFAAAIGAASLAVMDS